MKLEHATSVERLIRRLNEYQGNIASHENLISIKQEEIEQCKMVIRDIARQLKEYGIEIES